EHGSAALAAEAKVIVVGIAEAELANTPRLVLDELAHQTDRFSRIPSTAHFGLQLRPDGAWNGQQAACPPLLVQPVHLRRLDVDLGVVRKRLEVRAGAQVNAQPLPLGVAVTRVVTSNIEPKPLVERHRRLEIAHREDRRRAPDSGPHRVSCGFPNRNKMPSSCWPTTFRMPSTDSA